MTISDSARVARDAPAFPLPDSTYLGPDPHFTDLRERCPVARVPTRGGDDAWLVTRYADVRSASADPRLSRARMCEAAAPTVGGAMHTTPDMIISMDGAEHARLRKLVTRGFTTRRVEAMRAQVQGIADELLDAMAEAGPPADLVESLALPLPLTVIGELLGVPRQDLQTFGTWARDFATVDERAGGEASREGLAKLSEYIVALVADKRDHPGEDLLSELVRARDEHGSLSEAELVTFGFTLIGAGFDTTANQLANSVVVLLAHHREQWEWLAAHLDAVPRAVEELLRYVNLFATDTSGFPRVATEDIELGGRTIRAGDVVLLALASANRDRAVFDEPDRLDLTRDPNPHISFGHGEHHCLGMQLGRLELQIAFDGLLRRFPTLDLAAPESELPRHFGEINHTLSAVPVTW